MKWGQLEVVFETQVFGAGPEASHRVVPLVSHSTCLLVQLLVLHMHIKVVDLFAHINGGRCA